jgi:hypothetical protein
MTIDDPPPSLSSIDTCGVIVFVHKSNFYGIRQQWKHNGYQVTCFEDKRFLLTNLFLLITGKVQSLQCFIAQL